MSKKKILPWITWSVITVLLVVFDQFTKFLAVEKLKDGEPFVLIDGVFEFLYVENKGVAWGAFAGKLNLFIILTFIIIPLVIFAICRISRMIEFFGEKINVKAMKWLQFDLFVLIAGAVGNLIDRGVNGYVVDFLYFKLIDFPVFNVADCYITVAAIVLILISIICLKNNELDYLTSSRKKWQVEDEGK